MNCAVRRSLTLSNCNPRWRPRTKKFSTSGAPISSRHVQQFCEARVVGSSTILIQMSFQLSALEDTLPECCLISLLVRFLAAPYSVTSWGPSYS
jgi:hypothetical protein